MTQEEIKSFILSGCLYEYISYDHKQAAEYFTKHRNTKFKEHYTPIGNVPDCYNMPKEIKDKFSVKKIGKLRQIEFSRNGEMWRFKIGNKYSKTFFENDFGVSVKPILKKMQDKFNLIHFGLAIDAKTVNKNKPKQ